ncbi:hypothetical protein DPMN_108727 [Dreissena polymorpha]|uniref:Uncharacterized protein n=1 Tax=Dreissena polymorpha TaxID=45954 RepID=A0A9D4QLA2_DREPO|nr:hypothetical protein DPMN_108727 [Dreissena polymorpha]
MVKIDIKLANMVQKNDGSYFHTRNLYSNFVMTKSYPNGILTESWFEVVGHVWEELYHMRALIDRYIRTALLCDACSRLRYIGNHLNGIRVKKANQSSNEYHGDLERGLTVNLWYTFLCYKIRPKTGHDQSFKTH